MSTPSPGHTALWAAGQSSNSRPVPRRADGAREHWIDVLYSVVDDDRAGTLDDVLIAAGYRRRCGCSALAAVNRPCPMCGADDPGDVFAGSPAHLTVHLPGLHADAAALKLAVSCGKRAEVCTHRYQLTHAGRILRRGHLPHRGEAVHDAYHAALQTAAALAADTGLDPITGYRLRAWTTALPSPPAPACSDAGIVNYPRHRMLRCRIAHDPHPYEQPYGDALPPALLISDRQAALASQTYQPDHADRIVAAWRHLGDLARFGRYLAIVHGTTTVSVLHTSTTTVVLFDTAGYRAHTGQPAGSDMTTDRTMWRDWLDGDVYTVTAQTFDTMTGHDPHWRDHDTVCGVIGYDNATNLAAALIDQAADHSR